MKAIRFIWICVCYILSMPFALIAFIGFIGFIAVTCIKDQDFDPHVIADMMKSMLKGFCIGHQANMHWVEYGQRV